MVRFPHTSHAALYRSPQFGNRGVCSQCRLHACRKGCDKPRIVQSWGRPVRCSAFPFVLTVRFAQCLTLRPAPFRAHLGYSRDRSKRTSPLLQLQPFTPPCDATLKAGKSPRTLSTWISKGSKAVAANGSAVPDWLHSQYCYQRPDSSRQCMLRRVGL